MTYVYSPEVAARAVMRAAHFVGLTEVRNNVSWGNAALAAEFKAELLRTGWQSGWPYCAAFAEVVWRYAYQGRAELSTVKTMLTAGCLQTYRNAVDEGWVSKKPCVGAIGIMKNGATEKGHAFIVVEVDGDKLTTIEGNTLAEEESREGDGVYKKYRLVEYRPTTGLHLLGFITPCIYG